MPSAHKHAVSVLSQWIIESSCAILIQTDRYTELGTGICSGKSRNLRFQNWATWTQSGEYFITLLTGSGITLLQTASAVGHNGGTAGIGNVSLVEVVHYCKSFILVEGTDMVQIVQYYKHITQYYKQIVQCLKMWIQLSCPVVTHCEIAITRVLGQWDITLGPDYTGFRPCFVYSI